jgi:hypothetical protein
VTGGHETPVAVEEPRSASRVAPVRTSYLELEAWLASELATERERANRAEDRADALACLQSILADRSMDTGSEDIDVLMEGSDMSERTRARIAGLRERIAPAEEPPA